MRRLDRPPQALAAAAACFLTAAAVVVLTVGVGPVEVSDPDWLGGDSRGGSTTADSPAPMPTFDAPTLLPEPPPDQQSRRIEIPWAVSLAVVLALAALLAYVIVRMSPRISWRSRLRTVLGGHVDEPLDSSEELRAGVRAAGAALSGAAADRSGAEAVIEAWLALEAAAAGTGTARAPAQTPSEFTAALLRRHHADAAATSTLLALYHRARFSPHPHISDDDVAAAERALTDLRRTIAPETGTAAGAP